MAAKVIAGVRLFLIVLCVLAYCEDRFLSHDVTVLLAFTAWLALYAVAESEARR